MACYAPLMFQGGFGLSPNDAGLLVTPLAVCITVSSIANGYIVPHLRHPNVMVHLGLRRGTICRGDGCVQHPSGTKFALHRERSRNTINPSRCSTGTSLMQTLESA